MQDNNKRGCVPFNINGYVYVRLTSRARAALRKEYEDFWNAAKGRTVPSTYAPPRYVEPAVDTQGYTGFQLWDFMAKFGPILSMTTELSEWFEDGAILQIEVGSSSDR